MASGLLGCSEGKRVGHWSSVLFVFGGQRYGDSLVPSRGLRCGRKFCVWWAAVWRHFGTVWRAALWKEVLCLVGSGMETFWYRLEGCVVEGNVVA